MAGNVGKIYIDSPVFTREDEEQYRYVDTEVEGLTTSRTDEEVELDSVIKDAVHPSFSVSHDQHQPRRQKAGDLPRQHDRSSMLQDSLEADYSDSNAVGKNENNIVVADPSRYEDLMMGGRSLHTVQQQADRSGKPDVVPQRVNSDAVPQHYYLHDDSEEYEEAQLERQNQRREARRARVPHLELSRSDDEPSDDEAALDLEINDGHGSHGNDFMKNAGHGNRRRVNFRVLPHNSNSSNASQLIDSLEVAEYHPINGGDGGNPYYDRSLHAGDRTHGKQQRHSPHNSVDPHLSVYRNTQPDEPGLYHDMSVHDGNCQARASMLNSSAKRQQPSNHPPQTSGVRSRPDESLKAADFVEANRHNVNRKPQRSYGQIYSRKKGKENTVHSEQYPPHPPVHSASSVSAPSRQKGDPAQASNEQNSVPPGRDSEEANIPSAEQLWQARSRSLAARQESAESIPGKKQRGRGALLQNNVTRDVHVNGTRPVMPQPASSAPYKHQSSIQQFSAGSFTVPVQSEIPGNLPQKVSVDINLNVVSPRPLLNQPSTSLPIQYNGCPPQEVYQYSSRTQAYTDATGHYYYPTTTFSPTSSMAQPLTVVSQPTAGTAAQYTSGIASSPSYTVLPHSNSAAFFVANGHQQPMPHFIDSHGQTIPCQGVPQHLPIRYNYSYPQAVAVPVSDAPPQNIVHPYQMQPVTQHFHYVTTNSDVARENSLPTMASQSMSPYTVLPPVGSARKEILKPHSAPQVGTELRSPQGARSSGYAEQYRRQKKKLDYKAYTIDDYRKLKKEMKLNLGTLGPDLDNDSHKERKEKVQRQQEYARLIQERNRLDLQHAKQPKQKEPDGEEQPDRRRLAIEYAKKVPKPKVLPRRNSVDNVSSGSARPGQSAICNDNDLMHDELQRLQQRHQLERQQVALLLHNNT